MPSNLIQTQNQFKLQGKENKMHNETRICTHCGGDEQTISLIQLQVEKFLMSEDLAESIVMATQEYPDTVTVEFFEDSWEIVRSIDMEVDYVPLGKSYLLPTASKKFGSELKEWVEEHIELFRDFVRQDIESEPRSTRSEMNGSMTYAKGIVQLVKADKVTPKSWFAWVEKYCPQVIAHGQGKPIFNGIQNGVGYRAWEHYGLINVTYYTGARAMDLAFKYYTYEGPYVTEIIEMLKEA